jgi:hypothetical protein
MKRSATWTRVLCIGVAATVAALVIGVATAKAGDVVLIPGHCFFAGNGQITEPAGSTIILSWGYNEANYGILHDYLLDQTTTVNVNGGLPVNINSLFSAPVQQPDGTWLTTWTYPTGVTLANPGDTMTFTMNVTLARPLAEPVGFPVYGFPPGTVFHSGAGSYFGFPMSCIVTAT